MKSPRTNFILGFITLASGALFMSKLFDHWGILLLGIICYLLGTILFIRYNYLLSKTLSKESNSEMIKEMTEKLSNFRDELVEAKTANKDDQSQLSKIKYIESDFENWAKSFNYTKELRVLQQKKTDIEHLETLEAFNNKWRDVYQTVYQTFEKAFQVYSNKAQYAEFEQEFPLFPKSLFSNDKQFYAKIKFDKKNILYITLHAEKMLLMDKMVPRILIKWSVSKSALDDSLEISLMSLSSDIKLYVEEEKDELALNSNSKIIVSSSKSFDLKKGHDSLIQYILGVVEDIIIDFEKK